MPAFILFKPLLAASSLPNWEKVAEEGEFVSTSAASQRWGRLYKILIGDEKSSTPSKGKGSTAKNGGGNAKQKSTTKKKASTSKTSKKPVEEESDEVDGDTTTSPGVVTPKKRARNSNTGSDVEEDTPTKVPKTEVKDEGDD
ncbi:hypothetical protein EPUS_07107 [Endocarpon pusillum Z07020]|uniref:Myb-like DNA-binding domain-containing protein n=1 Tax=Endocarpon pusillum (strain Z07020 / HMAS-L-300199) TaxID=1263415 RepID=U1GLB0_ENDPU|nr:uncharacterized protein EPUS_07107 [Endocarpon pusillum Z07020]ERF73013.1 hypothetical protein EPUS_07107 [Endocarpon pusillum Z07020]